MGRVYNFSAGPSMLPEEVLQRASQEMLDHEGSGQSVMEMSHRSKQFAKIIEDAERLVRQNMAIPDSYEVLFLQGGASLQFTMIPMNFLTGSKKADITLTGAWAQKAYEEINRLGTAVVQGSSKDKKFSYLPPIQGVSPDADFFHITYNNTIEGTQYHTLPDTGTVPLVADISSGILSEPLDIGRFALAYAGAQKNLGPAGVTLVIVRKDFLAKAPDAKDLPPMLSYKLMAEHKSLYNTPPCYAIYILKLVQEWILQIGGVEALYKANRQKAELLYGYLDSSEFFYSPVNKADRSLMNIPFITRIEDAEKAEEINKLFVKEAEQVGLVNLAGHRSVGGMRASIYNAMPLAGVEKLVSFMKDFEKKHK